MDSAYSVQEGYEQVLEFQPDILFLDIEMPDGLGFDLLKKIEAPDFIVIFITAHEHYALKAIDFGAFDYLLKPPTTERLQRALDKVRNSIEKKTSMMQLDLLLKTFTDIQEKKLPTRMSVFQPGWNLLFRHQRYHTSRSPAQLHDVSARWLE